MATTEQLTVTLRVRERNRTLVLALMRLLAWLSWAMPYRTVVWLAHRVARLYRVEARVGNGPWQRIDHQLKVALAGDA